MEILVDISHEFFRNRLAEIIAGANASLTIHRADDYDTAYRIAEQNNISMFFLDVDLDKKRDGVRLGEALRKTARYGAMPIVFVSDHDEYDVLPRRHTYGFFKRGIMDPEFRVRVEQLIKIVSSE